VSLRALLGATVLLGAAVAVHATTPTAEDRIAPFVESVDVGEWGEGRTFTSRVEDVVLAGQVTDGDWTGMTEGTWVVVTLTAEAHLAPGSITASLLLGDRQFDASARAGSSTLDGVKLSPGLAKRGELIFEVPRGSLRDHRAVGRLRLSTVANPNLDSVVEVALDLAGLDTEELHELVPVERTVR
jgi:hypothetical protein